MDKGLTTFMKIFINPQLSKGVKYLLTFKGHVKKVILIFNQAIEGSGNCKVD